MTKRRAIYISLVSVFLGSMLAAATLPVSELFRGFAALPAIGALFGALFQILRDVTAHERAVLLQQSQHMLSIGATPHMANVAFDRHVAFCEEYVEEMWKAVDTLFREGPSPSAIEHATALYNLQRKYAVWMNPALERELNRFESAIRRIGATAGLVRDSPGDPHRGEMIGQMYSLFAEIAGIEEWKGKKLTSDLAVSAIISKLRKVLGTEELAELRGVLVARSLKSMEHAG